MAGVGRGQDCAMERDGHPEPGTGPSPHRRPAPSPLTFPAWLRLPRAFRGDVLVRVVAGVGPRFGEREAMAGDGRLLSLPGPTRRRPAASPTSHRAAAVCRLCRGAAPALRAVRLPPFGAA